jgi:transposase-like protein
MGIRGPKSKFSDIVCPNTSCRDFGIVDMENIVGNGTYETQNERVRKFVCRTCGKSFNSRSGTVFHDLRTNKDTFILGLKMVLNDIPLRKISYVLDIKLDTIRDWLLRAANHSEKVNEIFLKDLKISKVELDELWTFVKKNQFREWQVRRKSGGFG